MVLGGAECTLEPKALAHTYLKTLHLYLLVVNFYLHASLCVYVCHVYVDS